MIEGIGVAAGFKIGQRCLLKIQDLAFGGEGVARLDEFVCFVPFVIPGEEVEAEIVEVKKRFARARLIRVLRASPDRVEAPCRYFGDCGGCQYQHVRYEAQLRFKQKQIADLLERVGGVSADRVAPMLPCPQPYGYRNRIMVRSQWDKYKQGLNIGFIRADNRLVVDIEECPIAEPALNGELQNVRANPPPKGGLKVVLRVPPEGWEVPPHSFFQNNFHLLPELVGVVRNRLRESGVRFLVDAYCGVGFFSVELADAVERYVGIELDKPAVQAARRNAARRGKTNGEFLVAETEHVLAGVLGRFDPSATAVIMDPPRRGCSAESMQILRENRPAQVIYVSCHPATLARDLNILGRDNVFDLKQVVPLDMFPQTQHVECVADLRAGARACASPAD